MALLLGTGCAMAQQLPSDPQATCVVSNFSAWFKGGKVTTDGVVEPANSVTFPHQNNCQFYQWSEQMFLWLTSPAPPEYGGGNKRIYASPVFFSVSPPKDGKRSFLPNDPLGPFGPGPIGVRSVQKAAGGRQIVFTKSGEIALAEPAPAGAKPTILNASGTKVEVANASRAATGALVLKTAQDKVIALPARPLAEAARAPARGTIPTLALKRFVVDGQPIFVDADGNVVDVELGQAGDSSVLIAQNGSLVYYTISTNDVYAYFLTGMASGAVNTNNQFPTTAAQLQQIVQFAQNKGVTFPDPNALTVEVKAAWVEASGLANSGSYLTVQTTVPVYKKTSASTWTVEAGQSRTTTLALVGMHVVGSVAGHPEMVWATFEHVSNDPRGTYQYNNSQNATVTVPQSTNGTWTFDASNSSGPFNVAHQGVKSPGIVATTYCNNNPSGTMVCPISASDTVHLKPFGSPYNVQDPTTAASNTDIISINDSVLSQLGQGDVRGNYILSGATWTQNGAIPTDGNQLGTSTLANSTMETYQQGPSNAPGGTNCFTCHSNSLPNPPFKSCGSTLTTCVSHVFAYINPLR